MAKKEKITYQSAVQEIEQTLEELESAALDVDELAEKVKRVAELIAFCKDKLRKTEQEVEVLLESMDPIESNESGETR